jgi:hypothetical protein
MQTNTYVENKGERMILINDEQVAIVLTNTKYMRWLCNGGVGGVAAPAGFGSVNFQLTCALSTTATNKAVEDEGLQPPDRY